MVVGIAMVRDEADIVARSVGHMVSQVDRVVVLDNGSSDDTAAICEELGAVVYDDPEPGYYQSRKMSDLAEKCRTQGAEWIVPFDADEIWRGKSRRTVAGTLRMLPDWVKVCEADLYDHVATTVDQNGGDPVRSMAFRRPAPAPLPKWAVRATEGLEIHAGNHGATFPDDPSPPIVKHLLTIRHFPYRTAEQMIRKARNGSAAYAATDLPEETGKHWRDYGRLSDDELREVFDRWFFSHDPKADGLIFDPVR